MSNFVDEVKSLETLAGEHTDVDGARNLNFGYKPSFNKNETYSVRGSAGRIDLGYGGSNRRLYDNSGANIDVLVVWTNLSECLHSGLKQGCNLTSATETNMRGLIDLAIFETNTAFNLSGVNTSLRLVYAYRDSVYVEPTDWTISLGDLRNATDGKLDSVHAKRTLYGADAVHMIIGKLSLSCICVHCTAGS